VIKCNIPLLLLPFMLILSFEEIFMQTVQVISTFIIQQENLQHAAHMSNFNTIISSIKLTTYLPLPTA
jgi:hypothetical protein